MAENLVGVRVFVASPGGLEEERQIFRDTIAEANLDANERGISFIPVGWEVSTAGLGRPQSQINDEVMRCDYMVLLLHDRWGFPPSTEGKFSSGTEEEYEVARECAGDESRPMRNIAVLFKGVDPRQLSDPGDQLKKVLAFKERLEEERGLLYKTFDSPSEFERELRGLLARWTREQETGDTKGLVVLPSPNEPPPEDELSVADKSDVEDLLDAASNYAEAGRLTKAESLYAAAVVGRTDVEAMTQYARFLRRTGRMDMAEAMSDRLLEVARAQQKPRSTIEALSGRAIINRKRGNHDRSMMDLTSAVEVARANGLVPDLAFLLDNVGLTLRKQGQLDEALKNHREALRIKRDIEDDPKSIATSLNHAAAILRQRGDLDEAEETTREAIKSFEEAEYPRGQASSRANLGEILEMRGDLDGAYEQYSRSLDLNKELNSPEGTGMNYWQLGRLDLIKGELDRAERYAYQALRQAGDEGSRRPEAIGAPVQLLGTIETERGNLPEAIQHLASAAAIYEQNGLMLGAAWSYVDLAKAQALDGSTTQALSSLEKSRELGSEIDNAKFQQESSEVEALIKQSG